MLRLTVPKGSLEEGTFRLFEQANLKINRRSPRDYNLRIDDPRISETMLLRPQEIARYVADGEFDLGITGLDWIMETEVPVHEVADLVYSKEGWRSVKIVLATNADNPITDPTRINPEARVVTEYPRLTKRFFKKLGLGRIRIRGSYGATEVKVPRLAEYLVDVTETGDTLRRNNKKIVAVILESSTKLIANRQSWANPVKRKAIEEIALLLLGTITAKGKSLIKFNVPKARAQEVIEKVPTLRPPTMSALCPRKPDHESEVWVMIEMVVNSDQLNIIIPMIKGLGARDILEIDISKMIS